MSHVPAPLLSCVSLQTSTKLVACVLWALGPPTSERQKGAPVFVWPGVPYLSRSTALSGRTVERALRQLRDAGWIARTRGRDNKGLVREGWHRFDAPRPELVALALAEADPQRAQLELSTGCGKPVDESVGVCGRAPSPVTVTATGDGAIPPPVTDLKGKEELRGRPEASACAASRPARSGPAAAQCELGFDLAAAASAAVARFARVRPDRQAQLEQQRRSATPSPTTELDSAAVRTHAGPRDPQGPNAPEPTRTDALEKHRPAKPNPTQGHRPCELRPLGPLDLDLPPPGLLRAEGRPHGAERAPETAAAG